MLKSKSEQKQRKSCRIMITTVQGLDQVEILEQDKEEYHSQESAQFLVLFSMQDPVSARLEDPGAGPDCWIWKHSRLLRQEQVPLPVWTECRS